MRSQRSPSRRLALIVIVIALAAAGGGIGWVAGAVRSHRAEIQEFRNAHSEARIVGKTADEITSAHGTPYAAMRGRDGRLEFILYKQVKHGQYCGIVFKDGVAVEVSFGFQ